VLDEMSRRAVGENDEMQSGTRDEYVWFEIVPQACFLAQLITEIPELVVGKYVAITSFDSGPLKPSEEEVAKGWGAVEDVAYSPQVQTPDELPSDLYDEWWIFDQPTRIESPDVFVNIGHFTLETPKETVDDPTWDATAQQNLARSQRALQDRFWLQVRKLQPTSFLCDDGRLIVVTRDDL
jgi:hypothetical protein